MSERPRDLFEEHNQPEPGTPKELQFEELMHALQEDSGTPLTVLAPDVVQRLLTALRAKEKEATMYRLASIMNAHSYSLDDTDPDQPLFRKNG